MPAYVIVDVDVHDPATYETYKAKVSPTIFAHGGKYIVRGGAHATLEGPWEPKRVVVLEVPDRNAVERWWASPEYQEAKAYRQRSSTGSLVVVEGLDRPIVA